MKRIEFHLLVAIALTACGTAGTGEHAVASPGASGQSDASAGQAAAVEGERTAGAPVGSKSAGDRPAKPGAPVSLSFELPKQQTPGTRLDVPVTVTVEGEVDAIEITVTTSEGVELVGEPGLSLAAQPAGARHGMTISVIPYEAGFVNVFAATERAGRLLRRSFAIPLAVSGGRMRESPGKLEVMPDGRSVISLPAEERVIVEDDAGTR